MTFKLGEHELENNFYVPWTHRIAKSYTRSVKKFLSDSWNYFVYKQSQGLDNFYKVNGVFLTKNNRFFSRMASSGLDLKYVHLEARRGFRKSFVNLSHFKFILDISGIVCI